MRTSDELSVSIRGETSVDEDAIRVLTSRAFEGRPYSDGTEPLVIDLLRAASALSLSLVAVHDRAIVGHIAFSEVGPDTERGWFALGPVSVEPSLQGRGVGSQLIEAGLHLLRERGATGCVLLGDPRYYGRFGFVVTPQCAPPENPAEHFQVLPFGETPPRERVVFHPAFAAAPR